MAKVSISAAQIKAWRSAADVERGFRAAQERARDTGRGKLALARLASPPAAPATVSAAPVTAEEWRALMEALGLPASATADDALAAIRAKGQPKPEAPRGPGMSLGRATAGLSAAELAMLAGQNARARQLGRKQLTPQAYKATRDAIRSRSRMHR